MAALGSCAAAPTIVRITAAALTGMSHTHVHTFIDLKKYENTHTLRILSKKQYSLRLLHLGGGPPLPQMALFQAVFMPYFFFVNETGVSFIQLWKIIQQHLSRYPTKKIATVVIIQS